MTRCPYEKGKFRHGKTHAQRTWKWRQRAEIPKIASKLWEALRRIQPYQYLDPRCLAARSTRQNNSVRATQFMEFCYCSSSKLIQSSCSKGLARNNGDHHSGCCSWPSLSEGGRINVTNGWGKECLSFRWLDFVYVGSPSEFWWKWITVTTSTWEEEWKCDNVSGSSHWTQR